MSVAIAVEDRVLRITLDRPSERNQLTATMAWKIVEAVRQPSSGVGAVLLEGRGDVFCYGAFEALPDEFWTLHRAAVPIVAGVHGACLSEGVALIAQAHVVIAAQGTSLGLTEIRKGAAPVALHLVGAAIGQRRAAELALSGRVFSATEAMQMGLVHEVAPAFEYDERAEAVAHHLSKANADAVRAILRQGDTRI